MRPVAPIKGPSGCRNRGIHVRRAAGGDTSQQPSVDRSRKLGTTGYCMGGPLVMRTAATNPDRVGAAATFHGGGLVTDKPDSPHLLIPKMKAHFLIAIAAILAIEGEVEPHHPVEIFETFAALAQAGYDEARIAGDFGRTRRQVRQILALARMAPGPD